jgi:hypothetical protein
VDVMMKQPSAQKNKVHTFAQLALWQLRRDDMPRNSSSKLKPQTLTTVWQQPHGANNSEHIEIPGFQKMQIQPSSELSKNACLEMHSNDTLSCCTSS